jgi:hypothetical protein
MNLIYLIRIETLVLDDTPKKTKSKKSFKISLELRCKLKLSSPKNKNKNCELHGLAMIHKRTE